MWCPHATIWWKRALNGCFCVFTWENKTTKYHNNFKTFNIDYQTIDHFDCVILANIDRAPRLSISIVIWILSSDTICQLNQCNTNSEAAMQCCLGKYKFILEKISWPATNSKTFPFFSNRRSTKLFSHPKVGAQCRRASLVDNVTSDVNICNRMIFSPESICEV